MLTTMDLNGTWDFVADLDPKYHAVHGGYERPEANRRHWQQVVVPGVCRSTPNAMISTRASVWFAPIIRGSGSTGGRESALRFGGVNYLATVYLNGEVIGSHEGGYTEFVLDATDHLKPGTNYLAVQVDNRALITKWPPVLGYFNYGGIHRGVSLEIAHGPILEDLVLHAARGDIGWELHVSGRVEEGLDTSGALIARVSCGSMSWEDLLTADDRLDVHVPFFETPAWSPESPHLERVIVELVDDARTSSTARVQPLIPQVAMHDGKILVNGAPYPLKGVCYV